MNIDSKGRAFPLLTQEALAAMELLGTPIFVYDFGTGHIIWSNAASRHFWKAESDQELFQRELGPYSDSTRLRLADHLASFRNGEVVTESWTFYPKGIASPTISRCSGVSLEGSSEAMLVEIQVLSRAELPLPELRAIEALRHSSLMISMFSEAGEVLMRNPAAQAHFGELDKAETSGADLFKAMFADPVDCQLLLDDAMATGQVAVRTAQMAIEDLPIHALQLSLITDPANGQTVRLVTQQDVTMLVQISRQLAASEAALDAVLSLNVGPALVCSALDGTVLKANFAAQATFGFFPSSQAKVQTCFAIEAVYDSFRGAVLASGAGSLQLKMMAANGSPFWAAVSGARINYEGQDALVVLLTDINELFLMAADLETALDIERQTTEMQRRILAIAAHDLRTSLAIIDNTAQLLERKARSDSPDQVQARVRRIRGSVQHMLQLLESTIETTRNSLGGLSFAPRAGSICDVVSATALGFQDAHPTLQLSLDLPTIPQISFDRRLIQQALGNLLTNTMKYSDGAPEVEISVVGESEAVQIIVRDHGIGIPGPDREHIFDDYVRAGNVGERPGTGLGLSIVRQIADLHGGNIDIIETEGQGTTMRISLPRR